MIQTVFVGEDSASGRGSQMSRVWRGVAGEV